MGSRRIQRGPAGVQRAGRADAWYRPQMIDSSTMTYIDGSGVRQTVTLDVEPGSGGEYDLNTPGQLVTAKDIRASAIFKQAGQKIQAARIQLWDVAGVLSDHGAFAVSSQADWAVLEDCLIDNPNNGAGATSVLNSNIILRRCTILDAENALDYWSNVLMEDCYVPRLFNGGVDPHSDCIQSTTGADISNITVRRNTLIGRGLNDSAVDVDANSCIFCAGGSLSFTDCLYDDNVVAGGGYSMVGPISRTGTRVSFTNNKAMTTYHATCGLFGPQSDADDETWTGNELGAFSGGYVAGQLLGSWSGSPI